MAPTSGTDIEDIASLLDGETVEVPYAGDIAIDDLVPADDSTAEARYDTLIGDGFYGEAAEVARENDLGAYKEYRAMLSHGVERLYIALAGNRVTAATHAVVGAAAATGDPAFLGLAGFAALGGYGSTFFGTSTFEAFDKTEKHINEHGELTQAYADAAMVYSPTKGYCEEQGVYLAAKKHGEEETFSEAHRKHSLNTIPHF